MFTTLSIVESSFDGLTINRTNALFSLSCICFSKILLSRISKSSLLFAIFSFLSQIQQGQCFRKLYLLFHQINRFDVHISFRHLM